MPNPKCSGCGEPATVPKDRPFSCQSCHDAHGAGFEDMSALAALQRQADEILNERKLNEVAREATDDR